MCLLYLNVEMNIRNLFQYRLRVLFRSPLCHGTPGRAAPAAASVTPPLADPRLAPLRSYPLSYVRFTQLVDIVYHAI